MEKQPPIRFRLVHAAPAASLGSPADPPGERLAPPEWIDAQGFIDSGAAVRFQRFVRQLGDKRPPVFIQSPGGSLNDAMAIGALVRKLGLSVAVARTTIDGCPDGATACPSPAPGQFATGVAAADAFCASACVYILASGKERFTSRAASVVVHNGISHRRQTYVQRRYMVQYQVTNGIRREISRRVTGESRYDFSYDAEPDVAAGARFRKFLVAMGIAPALYDLIEKTPNSAGRRLTPDEMNAFALATKWFPGRKARIEDAVAFAALPVAGPGGFANLGLRTIRIRTIPILADASGDHGGPAPRARLPGGRAPRPDIFVIAQAEVWPNVRGDAQAGAAGPHSLADDFYSHIPASRLFWRPAMRTATRAFPLTRFPAWSAYAFARPDAGR